MVLLPYTMKYSYRTSQMADVDAAVLAIIDQQKRVLICKRADHLRTHPGEACLPGGKREEGDATIVDTALRESHEEIGLPPSKIAVQYELGCISSLAGIWVHPIVGTVADEPELSINTDEVAIAEWIPLEAFLKNEYHWNKLYGAYNVHGFDLPQLHVFGLTANICILVAIRELKMRPEFDLNPEMTTEIMRNMEPEEILDRFYAYYYENVRPAKESREAAKI